MLTFPNPLQGASEARGGAAIRALTEKKLVEKRRGLEGDTAGRAGHKLAKTKKRLSL